MALSYDVCVYILYDHLAISFDDKLGQYSQRPCGDHMETTQLCSHRVILTTSHKNRMVPV